MSEEELNFDDQEDRNVENTCPFCGGYLDFNGEGVPFCPTCEPQTDYNTFTL
jgi:hypothetical protein